MFKTGDQSHDPRFLKEDIASNSPLCIFVFVFLFEFAFLYLLKTGDQSLDRRCLKDDIASNSTHCIAGEIDEDLQQKHLN